ncbi:hypothetical protein [Oleiagrimonas sp. C23AA]|uniref:hypothetical protein n=1 Tax=Oleiagrimonas sp. C23AA TaxID=2719047 RepID=UPI00141F808D|nr:hypothetical protein [Oleiagrimonas sp. C23AA]NII09709.1 hypothetical protein [Oleiagrimonas sp. C23AA]
MMIDERRRQAGAASGTAIGQLLQTWDASRQTQPRILAAPTQMMAPAAPLAPLPGQARAPSGVSLASVTMPWPNLPREAPPAADSAPVVQMPPPAIPSTSTSGVLAQLVTLFWVPWAARLPWRRICTPRCDCVHFQGTRCARCPHRIEEAGEDDATPAQALPKPADPWTASSKD